MMRKKMSASCSRVDLLAEAAAYARAAKFRLDMGFTDPFRGSRPTGWRERFPCRHRSAQYRIFVVDNAARKLQCEVAIIASCRRFRPVEDFPRQSRGGCGLEGHDQLMR